jgi:hypothetical protein
MAWRRVEGSLGPPSERGLPIVPTRWRVHPLVATVLICAGLFVAAVLIGLHG